MGRTPLDFAQPGNVYVDFVQGYGITGFSWLVVKEGPDAAQMLSEWPASAAGEQGDKVAKAGHRSAAAVPVKETSCCFVLCSGHHCHTVMLP